MKTIEAVWDAYLKKYNLPKTTPFCGECTFGSDKEENAIVTAMVLSGQKQANCAALESYQIDMEPIPEKGNRYVVTDIRGNALCVIEIEKVSVLPFTDITWEMAKKESAAPRMSIWEERQRDFLEYDAEIMGYEFTPDISIVFEEFRVVYIVP
ncbi:MAG TPA: ASCH domain-containing protein [Treponemataceae bacterium]|nr:ASCH domain-containing protein [Treponemataceae bacterium]